jgi:RNA polymerase sigma factor (TIGR02999 family)
MCHERPGHTLQTTALVHETYLRLLGSRRVRWKNRSHFMAVSARLMRRVLVDYARSRAALKRGANAPQVPIDENVHRSAQLTVKLETLDDALDALSHVDARKARVVELRFFGGLSLKETAHVLDVSTDTVQRDWKSARAWLMRELGTGGTDVERAKSFLSIPALQIVAETVSHEGARQPFSNVLPALFDSDFETVGRPELRVSSPEGVVKAFALDTDSISVGRAATNTLSFPSDDGLSREHVRVERGENGWTVADLRSKNGTFVNGKKLHGRSPLRPGDVISASCITLTFVASDSKG